jgi:hypothetical protein
MTQEEFNTAKVNCIKDTDVNIDTHYCITLYEEIESQ